MEAEPVDINCLNQLQELSPVDINCLSGSSPGEILINCQESRARRYQLPENAALRDTDQLQESRARRYQLPEWKAAQEDTDQLQNAEPVDINCLDGSKPKRMLINCRKQIP